MSTQLIAPQEVTTGALPASTKVHYGTFHAAMRQVKLTGDEPALTLYDTSGPYTDPHVEIDLARGLAPLRKKWIASRQPVNGAVTQMAVRVAISEVNHQTDGHPDNQAQPGVHWLGVHQVSR